MNFEDLSIFRWNWLPQSWVDVAQIASFFLILSVAGGLVQSARDVWASGRGRRDALLIGAAALCARCVVPWLPFNWYSGVSNVDLGAPIYSKSTTYMPPLNQLITFTLGFRGILLFNIIVTTATAVLAWYVARRADYGERVAAFVGLGIALTPMYVRISASDSTHILVLPLWWLAAFSLQRLVKGEGGLGDQLTLLATFAAVFPIRIESGLVMPSIAFFIARNVSGLREIWTARGRWWPLAVGFAVGLICSVSVLSQSWSYRIGTFSPVAFLFEMAMNLTFLANLPIGWIPTFYVILIWYYVYNTVLRRDYGELASVFLPVAIFSIPFAYASKSITGVLPSTAYRLTLDMFLLLTMAKGGALIFDRVRNRLQGAPLRLRQLVVVCAAVVFVGSIAPWYRMTYGYMEEFEFLDRALSTLPRPDAKVLAIWDPTVEGGDYDCCTALPYPTFVGDYPDVRWRILGQGDSDRLDLGRLDFEYFYPGSLVRLDVENLNTWLFGLFNDPARTAQQQQPLRRLQRLERRILDAFDLEVYRQSVVPARTFGFAAFPDDQLILTIYRRRGD